jgi:tetraacyldisaccharide 4'-kinase
VILDDGLQNPSLAKDLAIAVVDGASGIGNGLALPAGPLRAPLDRQLGHVDAVVIIGAGVPGEHVAARARQRGVPVIGARLVADANAAAAISGRRVLAFAGIGRPEKFFATLHGVGAIIVERVAFPDHHPFEAGEIAGLMDRAARQGLIPVTTEKDAVRLPTLVEPGSPEPMILPVALAFDDAEAMQRILVRALRNRRAQSV